MPAGNRATIEALGFGWTRQLTLLIVVDAWAVPEAIPTMIDKTRIKLRIPVLSVGH